MKLNDLKILFAIIFLVVLSFFCSYPEVNRPQRHHYKRAVRVLYGKSSYYGTKFHGRKTANGEVFDMYKVSAAHKTLPFNTICRITNRKNKKILNVRINDRGPFIKGRILDLSYEAMRRLGGVQDGVIDVKIEVLELGE